MTPDVQYGAEVASVYDSLIAPAMPTAEAVERLRPHISGARVLEVGVGTGRIALPAAEYAAELVGLDNSRAMLDVFRAKGLPGNVTLLEGDFRLPLPVTGHFDAAYSTMGSLACVNSREELTASFARIREALVPGSPLLFEYYSTATYRPLAQLGTVTVPMPHHGGTTTFTITLDDRDLLTMTTRVEVPGTETVEFGERVLLVERTEVEACLAGAGFRAEQMHPADGGPYDWYTARSR
ncbi:class I SAM-dependent methyltransferase [Streptomyces sp. NPDC101132]|uniref:class I SAM-dependent methyltransferase n=1 Tax=Streptomyces sp. NPDC101132 TaxID=3366110 RepID=UPI003809426D